MYKYTVKRIESRSTVHAGSKRDVITKNGHTMMKGDIVTDLQRKEFLEGQRLKLIELLDVIDGYTHDDIQNELRTILLPK